MPMTEREESQITANFYLAVAGSYPAWANPFTINSWCKTMHIRGKRREMEISFCQDCPVFANGMDLGGLEPRMGGNPAQPDVQARSSRSRFAGIVQWQNRCPVSIRFQFDSESQLHLE